MCPTPPSLDPRPAQCVSRTRTPTHPPSLPISIPPFLDRPSLPLSLRPSRSTNRPTDHPPVLPFSVIRPHPHLYDFPPPLACMRHHSIRLSCCSSQRGLNLRNHASMTSPLPPLPPLSLHAPLDRLRFEYRPPPQANNKTREARAEVVNFSELKKRSAACSAREAGLSDELSMLKAGCSLPPYTHLPLSFPPPTDPQMVSRCSRRGMHLACCST